MNNPRALLSTTLLRALLGALITLVLVATNSLTVTAQIATPLASSPGVPQGSYPLSNIDTVNYFNGRVNINIPLWSQSGRGALGSQLNFTLNSPAAWTVTLAYDAYGNPIYSAQQSSSGWIRAGGYTIRVESLGTPTQMHQCWVGYTEEYWAWNTTLTRVYLVGPDGTEHEMRDVLTNGQPLDATSYCPLASPYSGPSRGKVFRSVNGSGATIIFDSVIRDSMRPDDPLPPGINYDAWVLFKDGRRYRVDEAQLRDRNGNLMSWPGVTDPWTDQLSSDPLNRKLLIKSDTPQDCATIFGAGVTTCGHYEYKGFDGAIRKIWNAYDSALEHSAIQLPNGLGYRFYYNQYGDLTKLELPGGGSLEYEYEPGLSGPNQPCGSVPQNCIPGTYDGGPGLTSYHVYRRVTERRVYREGHVLESKQTYSKPEDVYGNNLGYVEKKDYDGGGNLLGSEKHYFYGSANLSYMVEDVNYPAWKFGREYRTEIFDANGTMLRATDTTWEQRAPVSWWTGSSDDAPQNDPRVSQVISYLENGQSSRTTYAYDPDVPYNSLTNVYNYGFDYALLRRTATTYLKNLNGIDYTGSDIQSVSSPHLRDFPLQVSIYDGGGTERARTVHEYDAYMTDANHAGLTNRADISGFDSSYGVSYVTRANVTATTQFLLTDGAVTGSVVSYAQYDIAGNVVKAIDAKGNAIHVDYRDNFGGPDGVLRTDDQPSNVPPAGLAGKFAFAFPFKVTNALGHSAYNQFDYSMGRPIEAEDANGVISSVYFSDVLDRPTRSIRAVNIPSLKNQTTFSYDDAGRAVTTESDQETYNDKVVKSQTLYDSLGRTVETRQYESSTQYIATRHTPFVTLQEGSNWVAASQTSNPFRPHLSEQPVWTTSFSDAIGRVLKVRTPDNATVSTLYAGNTVTVTDPAGKQRKTVSDALGRLIHVYENPAGWNFLTSYTYDVFGNLRTVTQGDQTRTFVYDSLNRMTAATNPENGIVTYQYDESGNLVVRTDARTQPGDPNRKASTHFSYDALNRVTRTWYNGSNSVTATIHNDPALPTEVAPTDEVKYFYDSQSLPGGAPVFDRGYAIGRLIATTYSGSAGTYVGYDALGKSLRTIQQSGGVNFLSTANYDLGGAMRGTTYPSGHSVTYNFDRAGRLADKDAQNPAFQGNLGDGVLRAYSSISGSNAFDAGNRLQEEKFGTATPIYHKQRYNVRGQVWDIRASTVSFATDPANGDRGAVVNYYSNNFTQGASGADNNGNLLRQEAYVPGSGFFQDTFDYDPLNRLVSIAEKLNGTGTDIFTQAYTYDRYGNRAINSGGTSGGVNNNQAAVVTATVTNRIYAPGETEANHPLINYDAAGNQIKDYYTDPYVDYDRTLDAENKLKTSTATGSFGTQQSSYSYDGDGRRIKRIVNGTETWQVYGVNGELIAEYSSGDLVNPQKEYGYRNGQLLITATITSGWGAAPTLSDNPLVVNVTEVKAQHITELRSAINSLRSHLGHSPYAWQYSATTSDYINANPILEMRVALDQALGAGSYALGLASEQAVKAIHIQELRDRVMAAWQSGTGGIDIRWLVTDQLGTPRMIFDQSGSASGVSRHDYLPFGEEVPDSLRANIPSYTTSDGVRQHFTGYERDNESGLDYAQARYYANMQGRFAGVDPINGRPAKPQTWNRYVYAGNNPLKFIDPSGMSYFMGSGANDPWIRENAYRVDGFDMGPDGTASNLTDESMLSYSSVYLNLASVSGAASVPENTDDYGVIVGKVNRTIEMYECWLEDRIFGTKIAPLGEVGIAMDVTEVVIAHSSSDVGQPRDSTTQPLFGKWANDDRAHIGAKALGGPYVPINLTSQAASINRGPVKAFENGIRKTLTANKNWEAHLRVEIMYRSPDCSSPKYRTAWYYRPTEFKYSVYYTHHGARVGGSSNLNIANPGSWRDFF